MAASPIGIHDERGLSALTMILSVAMLVGIGLITTKEVNETSLRQSAVVVAQYDHLLAKAVAGNGSTTISGMVGKTLPLEATVGEQGTALNRDVYGGVPSLFYQNGYGYALQAATVPIKEQPEILTVGDAGIEGNGQINGNSPQTGLWAAPVPTGAPVAGGNQILYGSVVSPTGS